MVGQAYRYLFSGPKWGMNLLLSSVCLMIPIIGPIVYQGYGTDVLALLATGERTYRPDFTFDRFQRYLMRGLMPFLVNLVVMLVTMAVLAVAAALVMVVVVLAALWTLPEVAAVVVIVLTAIVLYVLMILLVPLVATPFALRAMLTLDFTASFDFPFARDFLRRTWGQVVLKNLIVAVNALALMIAGELCCGFGLYPALVTVMMLQWWCLADLYEIYQRRGGMTVPLKEPPLPIRYGDPGPGFEVGRPP